MRSEWDNYDPDKLDDPEEVAKMFPRGINNHVHHGLIEVTNIGAWFDQGTIDSTIESCIFRNYSWTAIGFNRNFADISDWPDYDPGAAGSSQADNTFLTQGPCEEVRDQHPNNTDEPICE